MFALKTEACGEARFSTWRWQTIDLNRQVSGGDAKQNGRSVLSRFERSVNGIAEAKGAKEDGRLVRVLQFS